METKVLFVSPTLSAAAWVRSAGRIDFFEFEVAGFRSKNRSRVRKRIHLPGNPNGPNGG